MKIAAKLLKATVCVMLTVLMGVIVYYNAALPDSYYVSGDDELIIGSYIEVRSDGVLPENYMNDNSIQAATHTDGAVSSRTEQLRLFGVFPIKNVNVTKVDEPVVIPCGTPFGIKLTTEGVLVVELTGFESGGEVISPAKEAGIEEGDMIISISGKKVSSNSDIGRIIQESKGQTLGVELERNGEKRVVFIRPRISAADDCYKAGMWVRDSSAGIGTMTFFDPSSGIFAGLGHPVCDIDTGEKLPMSQGYSADVMISSVRKSSAGAPGELVGMFVSDKTNGELLLNDESGVYGRIDKVPSDNGAVPVAMRHEVRTGYAEIYTTVNGCEPEIYAVEIESIDLNSNDCKNLIVKVTDERLLEKAGGIVRGMSGSPIIQNGKLIGAVTHVLVKDPTRGYGILADSMIECAEQAAA